MLFLEYDETTKTSNADLTQDRNDWSYSDTEKPACNDRLYNKIYYLWFIR